MPSLDTIRTLTIKATTDGVDDATKSLQALAEAQGGVAVASDTASKSTLSASSAVDKLSKSLDPTYKATAQLQGAQSTLGKGLDQGVISLDRYNQLMGLAKHHFEDVAGGQTSFQKAVEAAREKANDLTHELGPMGAALTAIGPVGLAIGAAIGVAILAMDKLKDQANEAGQWAAQLQNAADVIGINTTQLQALNEAAASVGVAANDNVASFEKFSVSLGQLKDGAGSLYTQLLKVNPALVNQLSVTKDTATGWNLLAQAYAQADKQQQALIARAAFGRGGAAEGGVLLATAAAGGIGGLQSEDAISREQIAQWARLTAQINQATEAATHNFQAIFTTSVLENEKNFAQGMLNISRSAREFALSEDLKSFIDFITNPIVAGILGGAAVGAAGGAFFGGIGAIPGALAGAVAGGGAAALMKGIASSGAASRSASQSALPPAPNFDATFGALDKQASDQAAASMGVQAAQAKALVAALGSVATAQERLDATTKSLNVELANHTITQETYNRAIAGAKLDAAISQQNALNSALGASTPIADLVAAKQLQLQKFQQQGVPLTQAQIDNQLRLTASQALGTFQIDAQTDAEKVKLAALGMSTQAAIAYQLVQTKINEAIALGKPLNDQEIAGLQKSADAFAQAKVKADTYSQTLDTLKSSGASFTNDLISGLFSGKNLMESLTAAANNLGKQLTSSGINNIFKDPTSIVGYVETGIGIITQLVSGQDNQALKDAKKAFADMAIQVVNFNEAAKGFNLGPLTQALQSLLSSYTTIQAAALKAHDQSAADDASRSFGQGVLRIVQQFKDGEQVLTPYAQAVKNISDEAQGLEDTLISLKDYTLANQVAISLGAQLTALAKKFADQLTESLQQRINTAQGKDYLNSAATLLTQHQQDILQAQQLGISQSLVQQTFAAEAQKIVDDAGLVGDAFNAFVTQFPQFAGVVHESSSALQDANDKFKQLTQTISTYLNSLALGSNSTLSPQQQLQLAQSNFQQQLSRAQGGDQTALSSITQSADAYLNAGKSFYASSGGYADIYAAVTAALQSLIGNSASSSTSAVTSAPLLSSSSIPGVIMPQASVTSAANDNSALFQTQTTALSQVFTQVGQANIIALQAGFADLKASVDRVTAAINANKGRAPRPLEKALGLAS